MKVRTLKKGDKVRFLSNYGPVKKGMVGTIVSSTDYIHSICVEWDELTTGHAGCFHDGRETCWFVDGDDLELLGRIEVGDRVKLITDQFWNYGWKLPKGTRGTVVGSLRSGSYTIRWDNWHEGHNGDIPYIKDNSCLFVEKEVVELVAKGEPEQKEEPKYNIVLFRQGNKVIAKLTEGKKVIITTEAKCSPEDKFNFFVGSQIALQRLMAAQVEDYEDIIYPVPETTGVREFLLY